MTVNLPDDRRWNASRRSVLGAVGGVGVPLMIGHLDNVEVSETDG